MTDAEKAWNRPLFQGCRYVAVVPVVWWWSRWRSPGVCTVIDQDTDKIVQRIEMAKGTHAWLACYEAGWLPRGSIRLDRGYQLVPVEPSAGGTLSASDQQIRAALESERQRVHAVSRRYPAGGAA